MPKPLDGIRVLDLSRILAGPFASQTLADLGAEVIKIERPGSGDDTRRWGPPYAKARDGSATSIAAYYLTANRGKKSVTVDIASAEGRKIITALADKADIVIENFKAGQLARYGLDAATLRARKPSLIYCSITGFGQTGPYATQPGYDFLIQGMGGIMSVTGPAETGGMPMKAGVPIADLFTGQYATIAILAALNRRNQTGDGETIDIALFDCQVAMLAHQAMNYLTTGTVPARYGNGHPNIVPYDAYPASDGTFIIAVGNDTQFAALAELLGHPEWASNPDFATNPARVRNRHAIGGLIADITRTQTAAHWLDACQKRNIPAGPVNTIDAVFDDPQVKARDMLLHLDNDEAGTVPSVASPIKLSDADVGSHVAPPALGADTDAILRTHLNLSDGDIANLRSEGVI